MTPTRNSIDLSTRPTTRQCVFYFWLQAIPLLLCGVFSAQANVYPTNVKVNGSFASVSLTDTNRSAQISYILNESASAGVTVRILTGSNVVRTISLATGAGGTLRGTNTVVWDGTGSDSSPVTPGAYTVAVTAAASGYPGWTQISDDKVDGNTVWYGRGIAVDRNTNSPYYGRVLVANSEANDPGPNNWLGYQVGILKCNADGSYADEGGVSTGGYPWAGDTYSPCHLEVSSSDLVYVDDFTTNGQVIAWDPALATNSELRVLRPDNWTNLDVSLSGPAISGAGTNKVLWMADKTFTSGTQLGLGILRYSLLPDGTCATNDHGTTAVAPGGSLTGNPFDVALDSAGNIYTIQNNSDPGDPNNRVMRFPPYSISTNNATPLTNADWAVGASDDTMAGAHGIAVDPTATYVAVAFTGLSIGSNGCTQIFYATNGALVTNLDLGVSISGFTDHEDQDCAWDAVGNVYYIDNIYGIWRAFSPPGTNQATTVGLATIEVVGTILPPMPPRFTGISLSANNLVLSFTGNTTDSASSFTVLSAAKANASFSPAANATITQVSPGAFQASVPASGPTQFYRIKR